MIALPLASSRVELMAARCEWGIEPRSMRLLMVRLADGEQARRPLAAGEHARGSSLLASTPSGSSLTASIPDLLANSEQALWLLADGEHSMVAHCW